MRPTLLSVVVVVSLLGIILWLAGRPILLAIGDFLVVQDDLSHADLIHMISGPHYRVEHATRLYQQGYAGQLFFTGRGSQAYDARALAISQGVPPQAVAADGFRVTSTYSEAVRLKRFIAQSEVPIRSVIISGDPYHMRRARWAYRRVLGDKVSLQMAPIPFESSPYQRRWWTDKRSLHGVLEEYLKTVYYYARYKFSRGRVRDWLASLDRD
jgi:uncharacterized SAM-binding protein YcdF (DUF218 family)